MLAELVDAVVGVDTHRDTHTVEIAFPTGAPIATRQVSNDSTGYAELLAWICDHAPGPRLVVAIEGTRSYGLGLARAVAAAGLLVLECERPNRKARRGKGKSDPIDAHLAVLTALRLDADRIPTPRADGDREALRILLCARQELTATGTAQTNRLRALLLTGDDTDRGSPAACSPTPPSPGWLAAAHPATPPGSRPSGRPRSVGSPWRCARTPATSRPIAASSTPW
jgi:transposase